MDAQVKPPVWKMVKEAVDALGGTTTNVAVRDWILKKYPGTNPHTVACQITVCTINQDTRINFSANQKPRLATSEYDFLFRPAKGELVRYDPTKHGQWEIAELEDGKLVVRVCGAETDNHHDAKPGNSFAAESHLRDFLAKNLHVIEDGLELYVDDDNGTVGVEFTTEMGRIDILAVDKDGGMLIVELKVARGPDEVCGQIMRYMGWVKRQPLAKGKPVRGLIIAQHISDRIRYALADVADVTAREYKLSISLHEVPHVDDAQQ